MGDIKISYVNDYECTYKLSMKYGMYVSNYKNIFKKVETWGCVWPIKQYTKSMQTLIVSSLKKCNNILITEVNSL
jgi:hypothetical protein